MRADISDNLYRRMLPTWELLDRLREAEARKQLERLYEIERRSRVETE